MSKKYILNFNELIKEKYVPDYAIGDIVLINYWAINDVVPVRITEIKDGLYLVEFNVVGSSILNAPPMSIKKRDILGLYKSVADPAGGGDIIKRKQQQMSNDIVINNYPKTI